MSRSKLVLLLAGLFVLLLLIVVIQLPYWKKLPYRRFMSRDQAYYAELAHACDEVKAQNPAGKLPWRVIRGSEASLPQIIRGLHADDIRIYPNRVWIGIGNDADSYAVLWEPDQTQSGRWVLMSDAYGYLKPVYSEPKSDRR